MFSELNEKQREAVEYGDGPLLIVAGAGSGKTKTLTARVAYLIGSKKVSPKNILAITFTNKAADQMKLRISNALLKINNEHSVAIANEAKQPWGDDQIASSLAPLVSRNDGKNTVIANEVKQSGNNEKDSIFSNDKKTDFVENTKSPFVGTFHSFGIKVLRENAEHLERSKFFSVYDRGDSMQLAKNVLKSSEVYYGESVSKKDVAIFLREVSRIKSELLTEDDYVTSLKKSNVWDNYINYEIELKKNNAFDFDDLIEKVVRLFQKKPSILSLYSKQYRYVLVDEYQDVNTAQYYFIKLLVGKNKNINVVGDDQQSIYKFRFSDFRNFLNFNKDWANSKTVLLEQNYRSTKNIVDAASELISNNSFQNKKKLWTENKKGDLVKVVEHNNEFDQADFISEKVASFIKKNKTIGILFRTNAQSRALESILMNSKIKYELFGAVAFYERKEIKDILAVLRIATNPKDSVSIERIKKTFYKRKTQDILDNIYKKSNELSPSDLIEWVIEYTDYFVRIEKNFLNYEERIENIVELIRFAKQFDDLSEFLSRTILASAFDLGKKTNNEKLSLSNKSEQKCSVRLMTMHLAKGLEFDIVIVAGVNEGLIPHQRALFSSQEIEEERRLMYVAMTRAKEELFLSFYDTPSRFLSEIPNSFVSYYDR